VTKRPATLDEAEAARQRRIAGQLAKARRGMSAAVNDIVLATRRYMRWSRKEAYYERERLVPLAQKRRQQEQRRARRRVRKIVL